MSGDLPALIDATQRALLLVVWLAIPVAVGGLVASALTAALQAVTTWSDAALQQVARVAGVAAALFVTAGWIARRALDLAVSLWGGG